MKKLLRNLSVLCFVFAAFLATGCYEEELPFLTVDHEVVLVGPNMDKGTVVVESNVDWEATSDVEWITLDNGFGNHKGTFEFFVDANTTPNERSGKIILDGGTVSVTILVRQQSEGSILTLSAEEIAFTKDAGEYLMSVACNGEWEVASSADWCKVNPTHGEGNGSFKVTVDENTTGADRTAILSILTKADGKTEVRKVVVTQSASNAALVVSPESQEITAAASTFTLDVISTGSWEASLDSDWLTLSETSGTGDEQITVNADANETGAPRIAVITFATGAENENRVIRQIVVKQAAVDFYLIVPVTDYPLSLDAQNIEIPFSVKGSNVDVKATSNSSWLQVSSVADGIVTVAVDENKTAQPREGIITLITVGQQGEPIVRQVRVAQAPTINVLDVLADEYAVEWVGAVIRVPIYTNTPVSVRSSESWCTATSEGQDLVINVTKNETAIPRVAVVTVTTESDAGEILSRTVIVRQAAAYSELVVTPETKNIYAVAQSFVASIVTNNSWTASSDSDWLTIDKAAGTGDYMLTVNAAKNETGQVRVATITVQTGAENSQRESATITVTQRPEQFYFDVPVRSFLFDKWNHEVAIPYVTSGNEQSVTASANVGWIQINEVEDGVANVFVEENTTDQARTGIVTITCTPVFGDPISIPVTFTQSPTVNILDVFVTVIDVMARGDEVALPYYANTEVSLSSSEEWCHVEIAVDENSDTNPDPCCSYSDPQKIIKIEVDPNRTGEARVAYVTISTVSESGEKITKVITVRQAALYAALSVTPKEVVLPAHEGHFNLVINTTGTWAISTSCTWLDTEDDWAGFGDDELYFWAGDNTTGARREGDLVVATGPENNEREEQVVHVIQLERSTYIEIPINAYAVSKEQQTLSVGYFAAGDFKDMIVDCSEPWIIYDSSNSDRTNLAFTIAENTTSEPRTATVTVTLDLFVGEPISDTFTVTQAPTVNILDVYVDFYEASPKGELIVFPFFSNVEVETSLSAYRDWLEIIPGTPNMNEDPNELAIRVKENTTAEARTGYVTLTTFTESGEKLTHIITIHQNPLNATLVVNPEQIIIPAHIPAGEFDDDAAFWVSIFTTGTWKIDVDANWIGAETWSGSGDRTGNNAVKFFADSNDTGMQREATIIVVTGEENETRVEKTVKVIQLATDTYLDIPQEEYLLSKEKNDEFKVACLVAGDIAGSAVDCGGADWITFEGNVESPALTFKVAENTTGAPRTTTVTVTIQKKSGEPETDSFTVTQAGTYNMLDVLADYITVSPAGDSVVLPALTNVENLKVNISEAWLKPESTVAAIDAESQNPNSKTATVTIVAEPNNTGRARLASVTVSTVTDKGETLSKMIKVFQAADDVYFAILSGDNLFIPKAMADDKTVNVVAYASVNADKVTMESNCDWLTKDGEIDVAEQIATGKFKASVNNTGETRTATVTVTFFDLTGAAIQKTVTITQAAIDGGAFEALIDYIVVPAEGTSEENTVQLFFDTEDQLTVSPSVSWLNGTAFTAPATDPQTLNIVAAENTTGFGRTGYLTISNGSESKVVTVFQPAKTSNFAVLSPDMIYVPSAGADISIDGYATENIIESIQFYSDNSWVTANGEPVLGTEAAPTVWKAPFKVAENPGDDAREALVKITYIEENGAVKEQFVTIVQAGSGDDNILEALVDAVTMDPAGDTLKIGFVSSEPLSSATSSSAWLKVEAGTENVKLIAESNTTGRDRTAYVTLRNSKKTALITVFQPANDTEFTLLTPTRAISSEAQTVTLRVYCSEKFEDVADLKCSPTKEWISIGEKALASENHIVTVPVKATLNDTGAPRTAEVDFTWIDKAGKAHTAQATITQSPTENILDVWVDFIRVPYFETVDRLPVFSNTKTITARSSNANWLYSSLIIDTENNTKDVKVQIAENETGLQRVGVITVNATFDDGTQAEKTITVVQDPKPAEGVAPVAENYLFLAVEDVTLPATVAEETVNVFTNATDYTVEGDAAATWLTATKGSVKLAAEANTGDERTAEVTVTATFADGTTMSKTLTVTQLAPSGDEQPTHYLNGPKEIVIDNSHAGGLLVTLNTDALKDELSVSVPTEADWLAVTPYDDAVLLVDPTENPNTESREAMITVTATYADGQTLSTEIKVFQTPAAEKYLFVDPEMVFPMEGAELSAPVTTNATSWIVGNPSENWFTATAGADALTVKANSNKTGEDRSGQVTITAAFADGTTQTATVIITQKGSNGYYLAFTDRVWLPASGKETKLTKSAVYTNAVSIAVTLADPSVDWFVPGVSEQPFMVSFNSIKGNTSTEHRSATIIITATYENGATETVNAIVAQEGVPAEDLYIYSSAEVVLTWNEPIAQNVPYFTNGDNVTIDDTGTDSWLIPTPTTIGGHPCVELSSSNNEGSAARTTSYIVKATKDGQTAEFTVYVRQLGKPEPTSAPGYIECNLGAVEVDSPAITVNVPFNTDAVSYTVAKDADWFSVANESAIENESANFDVKVQQNDSEKSRVGVVTVTATFADNSTKKYYLPVIQHPATRYFVVLNTDYDLDSSNSMTLYLPYISNPTLQNSQLSVTIDAAWIDEHDGIGQTFITAHSIVFDITGNSTNNARTGKITLTWTDPQDSSHKSTYIVTLVQPRRGN